MQNQVLLLRADEVARMLGLGRSKVFEMLAADELPGVVRFGRSVRVHRVALERFLAERAGIESGAIDDDRPAV